MKKLILIIAGLLLSSCYTLGSINKSSTLAEAPFAVVPLKGSPSEAAACVGKYWQSRITKDLGSDYQVSVLAYQVEVSAWMPSAPHPVVTLVVDLNEQNHQTIASAHVHPIDKGEDQETVTLEALEYCK